MIPSNPTCTPDHAPAGVHGFNTGLVGPDGFGMPATQHDAVLWLSGSAYDVLFDVAHGAIAAVKKLASVAEETSSWAYRHDRDLTGFIDGSENPSLIDASDAALIPEGQPGEGGSVLLLQKWKHDTTAWESLPIDQQERIMGRRKLDSVELDEKPSDSHVASTDQDQFGKIFRRNMPYGTSPITGPCWWDSVPISGGFPQCWRVWWACAPEYATRSRATRSRSVAPIISFLQPRACADLARLNRVRRIGRILNSRRGRFASGTLVTLSRTVAAQRVYKLMLTGSRPC